MVIVVPAARVKTKPMPISHPRITGPMPLWVTFSVDELHALDVNDILASPPLAFVPLASPPRMDVGFGGGGGGGGGVGGCGAAAAIIAGNALPGNPCAVPVAEAPDEEYALRLVSAAMTRVSWVWYLGHAFKSICNHLTDIP